MAKKMQKSEEEYMVVTDRGHNAAGKKSNMNTRGRRVKRRGLRARLKQEVTEGSKIEAGGVDKMRGSKPEGTMEELQMTARWHALHTIRHMVYIVYLASVVYGINSILYTTTSQIL